MGAAFQLAMVYFYYKHGDVGFFWIGAIFWLFVGYKIASFVLYKVHINKDGISKRPLGTLRWQEILFSDIERVEICRLRPTFRGSDSQLPTSRLELHSRSGKLFAISLAHFRRADIQVFLARLKMARPDLNLPALA